MQNCLTLAESMNMRSIAFPAVGTGLPKFPPDVVASEMFSQAQSFSSSSLMTIEFVIFHDNMDVIRVKLHYTMIFYAKHLAKVLKQNQFGSSSE